jgi:hypothetical protein
LTKPLSLAIRIRNRYTNRMTIRGHQLQWREVSTGRMCIIAIPLNGYTYRADNLPNVPEGHERDLACSTSQQFIWVEVSTRNSENKILNDKLGEKILGLGKLRKVTFRVSWLTPKILI